MNDTNAPSVLTQLIEFRLNRDMSWRELSALVGIPVPTLMKAIQKSRIGARNHRKIERFLGGVESVSVPAEVEQHGR